MTRTPRLIRITLILFAALALTAGALAQQSSASSLTGSWRGTVKAQIGEMGIALTIAVKGTSASGELQTAHGVFAIKAGKLVDGKWTLPFEAEDGATGTMKGVVKGDTFAGDWDFAPRAVGTFELAREK